MAKHGKETSTRGLEHPAIPIRVRLGRIPESASPERIREFMRPYGRVDEVRIKSELGKATFAHIELYEAPGVNGRYWTEDVKWEGKQIDVDEGWD